MGQGTNLLSCLPKTRFAFGWGLSANALIFSDQQANNMLCVSSARGAIALFYGVIHLKAYDVLNEIC